MNKEKIIEELLDNCNSQQLSAIIHSHKKNGPLLIIAGAGSGKTTVLTKRITYLITSGISPNNILALTFTKKAALEMKDRVEDSITRYNIDSYDNCKISTFHSLALFILKDKVLGNNNYNIAGYSSLPKIIGDEDSIKYISLLQKDLTDNACSLNENEIISWIEKSSATYGTPNEFTTNNENLDKETSYLLKIWIKLINIKQKDNCLHLNDLLGIAINLLTNNTALLKYYREKFTHILIDEYQDTNTPQYNFSRLLCGDNQKLFIVGDDDQSIYGFRGANVQNIINFKKDYPNSTTIKLETNYRSIPNIMTLANNIFKNKPIHLIKNLIPNYNNNELRFKENEKIRIFKAYHEREEFNFIAEEIKQLVKINKYKFSDIAILYRNNYQGNRIAETLSEEYEIPIYNNFTDGIKLNTLHASKGLEYPVVFYYGLCDGISPSYPFKKCSKDEFKKNIEEEKRLFYVGITRAKFRLYLTCSLEYKWYGKKKKFSSSRFLKLVPFKIIRRKGIKNIIKSFLLSDEKSL